MGINYVPINYLFQMCNDRKDIMTYDIYVQMVGIYNEQVRDLLAEDKTDNKLEIRSYNDDGLSLSDATLSPVTSRSDVLTLMKLGEVKCAVSSTALNNRSSCSHGGMSVFAENHQQQPEQLIGFPYKNGVVSKPEQLIDFVHKNDGVSKAEQLLNFALKTNEVSKLAESNGFRISVAQQVEPAPPSQPHVIELSDNEMDEDSSADVIVLSGSELSDDQFLSDGDEDNDQDGALVGDNPHNPIDLSSGSSLSLEVNEQSNTANELYLASKFAAYLKLSGDGSIWTITGPDSNVEKNVFFFHLLKSGGRCGEWKFEVGWSECCRIYNLKEGDIITLKLGSIANRQIELSIQRH
ncbi:hypothetical protein Ahy_B03g065607 [Arachis hypogaea]|uniref:Kinesin motor domain-containing protein n=1 Tax=Arachis hypogaea TaxID=3818 RepID=A0A445A1Z4_ARAHY|nr:hypothetical protein Ahy_B03g065607 [Arachis hypogaea]